MCLFERLWDFAKGAGSRRSRRARSLPLAALIAIAAFNVAGQEGRSPRTPGIEGPRVLFFDDFDGPDLDTTKWVAGLHVWGRNNRGVVPENLSLVAVEDRGGMITVLDTTAHGDHYRGPVKGIRAAYARFPMGDPPVRARRRWYKGWRVGLDP